MAEKMKRILDSVHGYVAIPALYVDNIIDTPQFQRLRRIEQTSCRALFPSARHDRFIHSIGVFHLGTLIVEHLWNEVLSQEEKQDANLVAIIITYRLACLLHDVGHTPFSHTFEEYFDNDDNNLIRTLASCIPEDENFEHDFTSQFTNDDEHLYAAHELLSAIVAIRYFKEVIESPLNEWKDQRMSGIPSLLVRMIVGCRYLRAGKSLENAFIELLHSEIIDADGLDYVCRDVWASGYSTSKVDVSRLISAIILCRGDNGNYVVCYSDKALNEIKSVLSVKTFQNDFVFNHHTIVMEQKILQLAMESAAMYHFDITPSPEDDLEDVRRSALERLCNINMYYERGFAVSPTECIKNPMDDDFIHLMKVVGDADEYINLWFRRKFKWIPLWKRKETFLADISEEQRNDLDESSWVFSDLCKEYLAQQCHTDMEAIVFSPIKSKNRLEKLEKAMMYSNGRPCAYTKIFPKQDRKESSKKEGKDITKSPYVCYIFIPSNMEVQRNRIQSLLLAEWKKHIRKEKVSFLQKMKNFFKN